MPKLLIFLFFFGLSFSHAQINGAITDTKNQPLETVNIYIENSYKGTTTNANGLYELDITQTGTYTILFKYLGFKTEKRTVTIDVFPFTLDVTMHEEDITLNEVVITNDENPANRIIRAAVAKRQETLDKLDAYTAKFYSRGLIRIKDAPEKIMGRKIGDLGGGLDSTRSGIIYLSETISDISFKKPNNLKETIIASKVSGDDTGFSFNTAIDVNFNFYNNTVELGNQLVSPIADYAFNYYRYTLEGVFYDDFGNLINKIKVVPKRTKDRVFEGIIYIVEDQWNIYALELNTTGNQSGITPTDIITLKQTFSYSSNEDLWALISQTIDFEYGLFGIKGNGRFTAVYSDYDFNPSFERKTFGSEILSFKDAANLKDSTFWLQKRPVPLTEEELEDYSKKDSIQLVRKSKKYLDSVDKQENQFKIWDILNGYSYTNSHKKWKFNVSGYLGKFGFNTVQGLNGEITMNYRKNFDESRRYLNLNFAANYGLAEGKLWMRGAATYKFNNVTRPILTIGGGARVKQYNAEAPILPFINSLSSLLFEENYMKIYQLSYGQIAFQQEVTNGLRLYLNTSFERRKPLYNSADNILIDNPNKEYTSNNPLDPDAYGIAPFRAHNILKVNFTARIRFGQKYFSYPKSRFTVPNSKFPTLFLTYEGGFEATEDNYNFSQLRARLYQGINLGNKGDFQYNLKVGTFFNADDIAFMDFQHFNGNQTSVGTTASYINRFNNLPYYSLSTNNSYFEGHIEHNFNGWVLGKVPLLNKVNATLVIGAHSLATVSNAPYSEFSIGLDNLGFKKLKLLRLDYVRSYQNGFVGDAVIFGLKFLDILN